MSLNEPTGLANGKRRDAMNRSFGLSTWYTSNWLLKEHVRARVKMAAICKNQEMMG